MMFQKRRSASELSSGGVSYMEQIVSYQATYHADWVVCRSIWGAKEHEIENNEQ
jgi:hypothetical protein